LNQALKEYLASELRVRRRTSVHLRRPQKIERRLRADVTPQLIAEYTAGESAAALARRYKVSKTAVLELVAKAGVVRNRNVMTPEMVVAARTLREQGLLYREIGARLGVHKDTVRRALQGGLAF
jgi:transposase